MSLLEAFWQLNESTGSFLATKLVYGKLSGLSRADPQSSSSSSSGVGRTTTTLALFSPQFIRISSNSLVYLPSSIFSPPIHSYIFRFIRISSFLNFFLPQFIRICSNSFLYLPSSNFFSPNSFVYLPIHSYIFWPFQGRPPK